MATKNSLFYKFKEQLLDQIQKVSQNDVMYLLNSIKKVNKLIYLYKNGRS